MIPHLSRLGQRKKEGGYKITVSAFRQNNMLPPEQFQSPCYFGYCSGGSDLSETSYLVFYTGVDPDRDNTSQPVKISVSARYLFL